MDLQELRKNDMMAHLIDSLERGEDIGHYGRLVVAMVGRSFLDHDDLVALIAKDADCDEEKATALVDQVEARGYNPPKRERVLEWMQKQEFPICPNPDDAGSCNVYKDLEFPREIYDKISSFYSNSN